MDQPCHVKCKITIAGGTEMAGKLQGPAATDTLTTGHFVACWALSLGVPENVKRAESLVYTSLTSLVTSNAKLQLQVGRRGLGNCRVRPPPTRSQRATLWHVGLCP
jgi:hypothetical protein